MIEVLMQKKSVLVSDGNNSYHIISLQPSQILISIQTDFNKF
jgi:hypothetical protein